MKTITQELKFERETKGTVLYVAEDTSTAAVRNVYVTKSALGEVFPDKIKIVITDISNES